MIVTTKKLFEHAYGKYAIGAYNINNLEQTMGLFRGNLMSKAPFIIQISKGARAYTHKRALEGLIRAADEIFPEAIFAVHLDHGDEQTCYDCIESGFYSSVMIDASHEKFAENIAITRRVADAAHARGIVTEAELGQLGGVEEHVKVSEADAKLTDPDQAHEFVEKSGCDSLACAIGTSHGAFKFSGNQALRFDVLAQIQNRLPGFPLVMHGSSSVPQDEVARINNAGGSLKGAIGVARCRRWWWSALPAGWPLITATIAVVSTVVPMVIVTVIAMVITTIIVMAVATISVLVEVVTPIRSAVAIVGTAIVIVAMLRATVTFIESLWLPWCTEPTFELFTVTHLMFGVGVELAKVVEHCVEVRRIEGRVLRCTRHEGLSRSLARPVRCLRRQSTVCLVALEVMEDSILGITELVDVDHEVGDGGNTCLVDLLEELEVGDTLLVVGDDVVVLDASKLVPVLEEPVGVVAERFAGLHDDASKVVGVTGPVVGRLVVGSEQP